MDAPPRGSRNPDREGPVARRPVPRPLAADPDLWPVGLAEPLREFGAAPAVLPLAHCQYLRQPVEYKPNQLDLRRGRVPEVTCRRGPAACRPAARRADRRSAPEWATRTASRRGRAEVAGRPRRWRPAPSARPPRNDPALTRQTSARHFPSQARVHRQSNRSWQSAKSLPPWAELTSPPIRPRSHPGWGSSECGHRSREGPAASLTAAGPCGRRAARLQRLQEGPLQPLVRGKHRATGR